MREKTSACKLAEPTSLTNGFANRTRMISVSTTAVDEHACDTLVSSEDREFISEGEVEVEELHRGNDDVVTNVNKKTGESDKDKGTTTSRVFDDGTLTYFWRAHTITVLIIFSCILLYVALFENSAEYTAEYNQKRGLCAIALAFLLFGVIHTPDGPFYRPHPAFWRLVLCTSILYELALIFLLFQNVDDARQMLKHFDSSLGVPLPEKDYGGTCKLYDPENPNGPWHNLLDKMDAFVPLHLFGWWAKTLILRDYWMCVVLSGLFEVAEYVLQHQLPNFSECWWDHWLLDFAICNAAGIYMGMKTCNHLSMRTYHWRGLWNITTYRGKLKRIAMQFTPHSWTDFDWRPTRSLQQWIWFQIIIMFFVVAELNNFYLKYVLWIPPPHFLCLARGFLFLFMGAVSLRETFIYLIDTSSAKRFGRQAWLIVLIIITEILIVLKFDWPLVTTPMPIGVKRFLIGSLVIWLSWTVYCFYLRRYWNWAKYRAKLDRLRKGLTPNMSRRRDNDKNHQEAVTSEMPANSRSDADSAADKSRNGDSAQRAQRNGRSGETKRRRAKVESQ